MTELHTWHVPLRGGKPTPEVATALRKAGGQLSGASHSYSSGGVEQHGFGVNIDASSATEALSRLRAALDGLGIYIPEEEEVTAVADG